MRKVLSFVLVLALVLSSFSMAFAADTSAGLSDIAGNANADAIQVAYDLGIITGNPDGTFLPDKAVNRAEFAAMLTRALAIPDSALAGYTTTSFKDTAGYNWAVPYLAFCQSKGIMLGDGEGNAMPGRTVTVNEAVTMALRAIGYTANSALLVGAWPANYVSIAQNEDLYDDVSTETTVNKASAAQIIYNLLTVQKVAVNSDGTTDYLWKDKDDDIAANLLNTNLGCTEEKDVILGYDYDYDDAIINITGSIGAFGTAYLNDDDELVAFTKDSTALTGKFDGSKFKVGDTKYDLGTNSFTGSALFANTDTTYFGQKIDKDDITSWAAVNANNNKTVTLHVELSGKNIKDIYSVVAWFANEADLAASDVQEDIADHGILSYDFVEDDDDNIDYNSFELAGVASLDKIAEDDVVYVYVDGDNDIRKVEVGTETLEGTVEELDEDGTLTIGGKEYDLAPASIAAVTIDDFDEESDGTYYLDVNGEIYDFDGSGTTDTYGVVKAANPSDSIDNIRVKLYKSDDSTSTLYLADDDDIDWTSAAATAVTNTAVSAGALIGYSLDSDGDIDAIDNTVRWATANTNFQSTKVLKLDGKSYSIDSDAAVFTYKGQWTVGASTLGTIADPDDYDVASLSEVETGSIASTTAPAFYIINEDGKIAALFLEEAYVDKEDDAVYGVFNGRTSTTTDGDKVYKYTGFIDGAAFTYKTDNQDNDVKQVGGLSPVGLFGVYGITLDASDQITKIEALSYSANIPSPEESYMIVQNKEITDLSSDKTVITVATDGKFTIADDAVVYKWDADDEEFEVSKLTALRATRAGDKYYVSLYDTKGDDADGIASVVIFYED